MVEVGGNYRNATPQATERSPESNLACLLVYTKPRAKDNNTNQVAKMMMRSESFHLNMRTQGKGSALNQHHRFIDPISAAL